MNLRPFAPAVCALGLFACSGGAAPGLGGDGADGGVGDSAPVDAAPLITIDQAAKDAANAYCQRVQACAPAYVVIVYGDAATCATAFAADLVRGFGGPGVNATPDWVEACAAAIPQASCGDLLGRKEIAGCKSVPGALADGTACAADAQCKSTRCRMGKSEVCGVCGAHSVAGAACGSDDDCDHGLTCASGACQAYGDEKATCDGTHPCRPDLACSAGLCGKPNPVGTTPCSSSAPIVGCDQPNGVFCNPTTQTCEAIALATDGSACGLVGGRLTQCHGPSACVGVTPPKYQGTCAPGANLGAACDTAAGPPCGVGAVCACAASGDGGCAGTCKVRDPAACH